MYLTHAEIDISRPRDLEAGVNLARKYKAAALVLPPDLVHNACVLRSIKQSNTKIICAVDWHKGENYGTEKFIGVTTEALKADGFEILLSNKGSYSSSMQELKYLSMFVRQHVNPAAEVRFVLGMGMKDRTAEGFGYMLDAMKTIPHPTLVRDSTIIRNDASPDRLMASIKSLSDFITDKFDVKIKASVNAQQVHFQQNPDVVFGITLEHANRLVS